MRSDLDGDYVPVYLLIKSSKDLGLGGAIEECAVRLTISLVGNKTSLKVTSTGVTNDVKIMSIIWVIET